MRQTIFTKIICLATILLFMAGCFQPLNDSSQEEKIDKIVAASKTEAILIKSESDSVESLSLLNVADSSYQISWKTILPANISFLNFEVEVQNAFVFIPFDNRNNDRKLLILNLFDGKIIGELNEKNDWICINKNELFLKENGYFKLYKISDDTVSKEWEVQVPENDNNYSIKVTVTQRKILVSQNKDLYILDKATGELLSFKKRAGVIGFSEQNNEIIAINGNYLNFHSTDNKNIASIDLSKAKLFDTIYNQSVFLGKVRNNWLILVATDLPHQFMSNGTNLSYEIPSNHVLLAIDTEAHELQWELPLDKWEWSFWYGFSFSSSDKRIAVDKELNEKQLFHVIRNVPNGSGENDGLLAFIDLTEGKIIWQTIYHGATRSNVITEQKGKYFYLRLNHQDDLSKSVLAQFTDGELTNAFWLKDYQQMWPHQIHAEAIWMYIHHKQWYLINPEDFSTNLFSGQNPRIENAMDWVKRKLSL